MFEPIGESLTCAWSKPYTLTIKAGYHSSTIRGIRSVASFRDYVRFVAGVGDELDTYISSRGKDGFSRTPPLITLDPRTGNEVLHSPSRVRNASPGRTTLQGAGMGNYIEPGELCVSECGDFMYFSYGSDLNYKGKVNKFTGESAEWNVGTGSNWGGIAIVSPDNERNTFNAGTAPYFTRESVYTRPLLYRDEMVRATQTATGLQLTCTRLRDASGARDVVWSNVYAGYKLGSGLSLGEFESIVFFALFAGKYNLCCVTAQGEMLSSRPIDGIPSSYNGRIIPPPVTTNHVYTVDAIAGSLKLVVNAYSLSTGKRTTTTVPVNFQCPSAAVFHVTANHGRLIVQVDTSTTEHVVVCITGDATPAYTPPPLPRTGYVPLTTVNMTPTYAGDAAIIAPVDIGIPNPLEIDTQATEPRYAGYFKFPVQRGARGHIEFVAPYIDDTRSDPADFKVYACADNDWLGVDMRRKTRPKIGAIVGRYNVGRTTRSGMYRIAVPVTDVMNAATGDYFTLVIGGTEPPRWGLSSLNFLGESVRLVVEPGEVPPVPLPPVEPAPTLVDITIHPDNFDTSTASLDGREWHLVGEEMAVFPTDGFNYVTADNAKAKAPHLVYSITLPAGKYAIAVTGKGPDATRDSVFVRVNGGAVIQANSFTPAGSTRPVGTFDLPAGNLDIFVFARECGFVLQSITIKSA